MKITILSKEGCTMCDEAVELCQRQEVEYEKVIVDKMGLMELCGVSVKGYPQILKASVHLGTFFDLEDYLENTYEPLLGEGKGRYTVFPIKYQNLWSLYKKAQMSVWTAEEIDFSKDMEDWDNKLSDNDRHFIKHVLAFFAASDGIVFENISLNFANDIHLAEARSFYAYQSHNEMVHGETYSLLIDKYVKDPTEKDLMFTSIESIDCIKQKAQWALKWFDTKNNTFADRLIAFACVEGIFFSGSFCAIFWLKKRGLLPGLGFSNELISRDEAMHLEFAIELYNMLRHPSEHVYDIVKDAVRIEKQFINEALPCKLIGMDSAKMSQYIEYVADRLLKQVGLRPLWNTENPFDFMENISLEGKTNFFEKRVSEYSKLDDMSSELKFTEEF
jgi:ribonucleoside-diphosphate reductase subunit M2